MSADEVEVVVEDGDERVLDVEEMVVDVEEGVVDVEVVGEAVATPQKPSELVRSLPFRERKLRLMINESLF